MIQRLFIFLLCLFSLCVLFDCRRKETTVLNPPVPDTIPVIKKLTPADSLVLSLDSLKTDSAFRHASFSWCILDYSKGIPEPLYAFNEEQSLVPASVLKILTTGAALGILGEGKSFRTTLQYDGTVENRILKGNLYIRGGGDPTFGSGTTFTRWVNAIRELGIDTVTGAVIGDGRIFGRVTIPLTWTWGELQLPYCAPASGLTVFGNVYQGTGDRKEKRKYKPVKGSQQPDIPQMMFENEISEGSDVREEIYVVGDPYSYSFYLQGTLLEGQSFFPYAGVIPDPAYLAALELKNKLAESGVFVAGEATNIEQADSAVLASIAKDCRDIAFAWSPSVATLVALTNLQSNNLFAEHLIKQIGLRKHRYGSTEAGCKAVSLFWKEKGIDTEGMFLYDGCGISRYNAVTSKQLADVLFLMTRSPGFQTFYNSLPLAGVSGTMAKSMKGTSAEGNIRAKTGTISRVKSYAGYSRSTTGKRLIFSFIVNNFSGPQGNVRDKLERIMVLMTHL